jgi:nitroreductase
MSDRKTDFPIDSQFVDRWSPRSFTGEPISREALLSMLEAARWAPSGFNSQPWRFVYALAGTPAWEPLFSTLAPRNQAWASRASALVLVVSKTQFQAPGQDKPSFNRSHAFDAGAAWGYLALQAHLSGWHAHGMGGFDHDAARSKLGIPADHETHAVIAIGRRGDKSQLPEALQALEMPNQRQPLTKLAAEGRFALPA